MTLGLLFGAGSCRRRFFQRLRRCFRVSRVAAARDEDADDLAPAIRLARQRHLVMVANLRERVMREMAQQVMLNPRDIADVAAAHLFEQARRDAFQRAVGHDKLSLDVEPAQLAVALVNRYHAVKRAGML